MKKWFFTNSTTLQIWTYGSGDTPEGKYQYYDKETFECAIESFQLAGFDFIKDQGV
jgi:hypothetical protein